MLARSACIGGVEPTSGAALDAFAPAASVEQPGPRQLEAAPLDFEHQRRQHARRARASGSPIRQGGMPDRSSLRARPWLLGRSRDVEDNRFGVRAAIPPDAPATACFAQLDGSDGHESAQRLLERPAHQRDVALAIESPRQCGEEIRECLSTIALAWCEHGASRTKSSATTARSRITQQLQYICDIALPSHTGSGSHLPVPCEWKGFRRWGPDTQRGDHR